MTELSRNMFYYVNKIVFGLMNPISVGLLLLFAAVVFGWLRRGRAGLWLATAALVWFVLWSFGFTSPDFKVSLEEMHPPQRAEDMPKADAIVVLGGGMCANTNTLVYAEMHMGADRVWHAARLWKAGRAPVVIASGVGEADASYPLLRDLGVPESAIVLENAARNTEENAGYVVEWLKANGGSADGRAGGARRILLVTSAMHMRRAVLMFERAFAKARGEGEAPVEVVPAAADYDGLAAVRPFRFSDVFPSPDHLYAKSLAFKEILGYWGYRLLRR
jgi:uncharacterized SAM-binding protein YcdF (DUF218 family)